MVKRRERNKYMADIKNIYFSHKNNSELDPSPQIGVEEGNNQPK
jgi:hypothetical protein